MLAPSVTVGISTIYGWIKLRIDKRAIKQELASIVERAKQTLNEAMRNPTTSEAHREQLRKELESLELLLVKSDVDKIRILTKSS